MDLVWRRSDLLNAHSSRCPGYAPWPMDKSKHGMNLPIILMFKSASLKLVAEVLAQLPEAASAFLAAGTIESTSIAWFILLLPRTSLRSRVHTTDD